MADQAGTPRARYREHNRAEIKRIALEQLAERGPSALSLSAIAKRMGFSGPALYRYFASRDELLTELITAAYGDLAGRITETADAVLWCAPRERLRILADAFRQWAVAEPHRYQLLAGTPVPGYSAPPHTVAAAREVLGPFLAVFHRLQQDGPSPRYEGPDRQFQQWIGADRAARDWVRHRTTTAGGGGSGNSGGEGGDGEPDPARQAAALRATVTAWTRMHGLVSLELQGSFHGMSFDPALLYAAEIDALADQA
ncbi:TetR/AcrR family transcriptional regulator [Streptomyces sp. N2-109]|uniref:TetR/AcrR family transcriptional regulator n=1 Tax=Streptomyces gossypii TaxID=2883101 RepID=A0ABT2JMD6_9ACTN|nr:TetR/AcrR family transcriptional regulator [Streptomyces gossypii]MCT2589035.1 TetR/AcrR family transcriptional regulator [Streptomyces gossypii]